MRLRTNDVDVTCEECQECQGGCVDGGHVLRCAQFGDRPRRTASAVALALRGAAEEVEAEEIEAPRTAEKA
eukprot:7221473-Prymnesium_polylepis.1